MGTVIVAVRIRINLRISNSRHVLFHVGYGFESEYHVHVRDGVGARQHEVVVFLPLSLVQDDLSAVRLHLDERIHLLDQVSEIARDLQYVRVEYRRHRSDDSRLRTSVVFERPVVTQSALPGGLYPGVDHSLDVLFRYCFSDSGTVADNQEVLVLLLVLLGVHELRSVRRVNDFLRFLDYPVLQVDQHESARVRQLS